MQRLYNKSIDFTTDYGNTTLYFFFYQSNRKQKEAFVWYYNTYKRRAKLRAVCVAQYLVQVISLFRRDLQWCKFSISLRFCEY